MASADDDGLNDLGKRRVVAKEVEMHAAGYRRGGPLGTRSAAFFARR